MSAHRPALIIIDMQKCMATDKAGERNNPSAEHNMARLLDAWREGGHAIVHVRHISRSQASLFSPGQPGAEFQPTFLPLPEEHVVEKNVPDAFVNTALERWLRVRDISSLVMVGVSTNISVECSARTAGNLGFSTTVVSDATFTFAKADYAGTWHRADEVHAMSLANLAGEYANVEDTDTVLDRITRRSRGGGNPS